MRNSRNRRNTQKKNVETSDVYYGIAYCFPCTVSKKCFVPRLKKSVHQTKLYTMAQYLEFSSKASVVGLWIISFVFPLHWYRAHAFALCFLPCGSRWNQFTMTLAPPSQSAHDFEHESLCFWFSIIADWKREHDFWTHTSSACDAAINGICRVCKQVHGSESKRWEPVER